MHYQTDGHGFRNAEPWPPHADIVVVGDAVAFGYGVEDTQAWPARLARAVAPTHVLNLGLLEAGPRQYARVYATFGTMVSPKLVLIGLSLADDVQDAELFARWEQENTGENYRTWREEQDLFGGRASLPVLPALVARYSYLYQMLWASHRLGDTSSDVLWFPDGQSLRVWPSRLAVLRAQARPERRVFHLVDALTYLQTVARAYGVQVLVVMQPSKEMAYLVSADEGAPDPSGALRQALAQCGIASLDLTPVFCQWATKGEVLFFATNRYPNAHGHALIAREIVRYLAATAPSSDETPAGP